MAKILSLFVLNLFLIITISYSSNCSKSINHYFSNKSNSSIDIHNGNNSNITKSSNINTIDQSVPFRTNSNNLSIFGSQNILVELGE